VALALVTALLAINVYRAATQAITMDEARFYADFVAPPYLETLRGFDANNHVLYTDLCRASVAWLGPSEFSLRLPSLLAGWLYFAAALGLARRTFGGGGWFLLAVVLLTLNPFVLDHLVAARGYGLALALMLWLIDALLDHAHLRAGVLLGLLVAANAIFLFPAAALLGVYLLSAPRQVWPAVERTVIPGATIAFGLMFLPFSHATPSHFYFGCADWQVAISQLAAFSLFHHDRPWVVWGYHPDPRTFGFEIWRVIRFPVAALALAFALSAGRNLARLVRGERPTPARALALLAGGGVLLAAGMIEWAHVALGMNYPLGRTALFAVPLVTLAALAALGDVRLPVARRAAAALGCALGLQYGLAFNVSAFGEWDFNERVKDAVKYLDEAGGERPIRIGATWLMVPSLRFYSALDKRRHWVEIDHHPFARKYDFVVLADQDFAEAQRRGLRIVYRARQISVAR
jgi:hypothetical protein